MNLTHPYLYLSLLVLTLISFTACNDDDSDDMTPDLPTEELLIGEWETTNVEVFTKIDDQTVAEYLVLEEGLSPLEAEAQEDMLQEYLATELTVNLTFFADSTYESIHVGGMDSGTWSLSEDEMTLTLVEGGELIIVDILSISEAVLRALLSDRIDYDIDNDANTPDVAIDAEAILTMEK